MPFFASLRRIVGVGCRRRRRGNDVTNNCRTSLRGAIAELVVQLQLWIFICVFLWLHLKLSECIFISFLPDFEYLSSILPNVRFDFVVVF